MNLTKMIVINYKHNRLYTFGCTKEKINIDEAKDIDKSGISPSIALALGKAIGVLISEIQDKSPFKTMRSLHTSLQTMFPELNIQYGETTQNPSGEFKEELEKRNTEPPHIEPRLRLERPKQPFTDEELKIIEDLESKLNSIGDVFIGRLNTKQTFMKYVNEVSTILNSYIS